MGKTPSSRAKPKYYTVLEQDPAHLTAIGTLAVEIVNVEVLLAELLAAILGLSLDVADAIFFAPQATGPRISILAAAVATALNGSPHLKEATDCADKARQYANKRNDTLHQAWGYHDDVERVARRPLPFTVHKPPRSVPVTEIEEDVHNVRLLAERIIALADRLNSERDPPAPSRGRPPIPRGGAAP